MSTLNGYVQFCPVAMASEVLARRWTPLILRELLAGSSHFNEIRRGLPLTPRTTLANRLRALESAGVLAIEPSAGPPGRCRLTTAGLQLRPAIQAMGDWGQRWTARFEPNNLDPGLLMWNLRRRLDRDRLASARAVIRFEFDGLPPGCRRARRFWLPARRAEVDLCVKGPGLEVDVYISADVGAFARVWLGERSFDDAVRERSVRPAGQPRLVRDFPRWLLLSPFARRAQAPVEAPST